MVWRSNAVEGHERTTTIRWGDSDGLLFGLGSASSRALGPKAVHTPAAMIHDSTPGRVFWISELSRLVANHLVLTSRKSAANLARACQHLEEPVLSTLWSTQSSLRTLLEVLPGETWDYGYPDPGSGYSVRGLDLLLGNRTLKFRFLRDRTQRVI